MFIDEDGKWMEMDMISHSKLGLFWSVVIPGTLVSNIPNSKQ